MGNSIEYTNIMKCLHLSPTLVVILSCTLLSGCFKWAARAEHKLPQETALHKTYAYEGRVIIVGAGASGLAAAKVLEQNNIDYLILEATNRYGGRLKKDTTLADFPIDLGAEWLHSAPITLNILKGKHGEEIDEELIPYHLKHTANWDGETYQISPDWQNNFRYRFMPESKFKYSTWYDFVNDNIASTVKHKIRFNSPVTTIDYSGDEVIVGTRYGDMYKADRVIVTVSIGVLQSNMISFIPKISDDRREAIESISFLPGLKLVMKFSEKFYPDAINCSVEHGEKVFYDIAFQKEAQTNVLGFLCVGGEAQKYYDLQSEQEIVTRLLQELDQIFDGKATATYSGDYILENWSQHEFIQGTWTQAIQEKRSSLNTLNQPLNNKVYFAGEIYDPYQQMGVPGAILSGYYSVDKLLTDRK